MGTNEDILLRAQAGLETTRGTNVVASRKVYAQITPTFARPLVWFRNTTGTFHGRRRPAYARIKPTFSGLDEATYQDLAWWLQMMMKGGVTGSADAGTPIAYTYTFNPTITSDDLKSFTLEFNDAGNPYEVGQCMVDSWTLRMDADNDQEPSWMLDLNIKGRDFESTTFTTSLTDRTTEPILARGTKLYIDDAGGTMGATQKTGTLISCSLTGSNNLDFKAFAEDPKYAAANKVGRGEQYVDGQFTFEFDSDTEFAKYRHDVPQQRLVRLEQSGGTAIHDAIFPRMRVDMWGYWASWSRGTRVNNLTQTFGFNTGYDATAAKSYQIEVVNALSTLA